MPDATVLLSLADLKTFLGIAGTSQDTILQAIKDAVEYDVKTYCGRDFIVTSYTEYYDGDGGAKLLLNNRPIISVSSLYADPARLFNAGSQIPTSDIMTLYLQDGTSAPDVRLMNAGIVELYLYRFLTGRKSVKIVYSAGHSTIPTDLAHAVKLICSKAFKIQSKQLWAEVTHQVGDMTITLSTDQWPKDAAAILDRYRKLVP